MNLRRLVWIVLAVSWGICSVATAALAQRDSWRSPPFGGETGFGRDRPGVVDLAFYDAHAVPSRGPLRSTGDLVWRMETDGRTSISYPRVVSRPGHRPIAAVNLALKAVHGRLLGNTLSNDIRAGVEAPEVERKPGWSLAAEPIKVTYASADFLSILATGGHATAGNSEDYFVLGVTIDMRTGRIFGVEPCGRPDLPTFTFADVLDVCTEGSYRAFFEIWKNQNSRQAATVEGASKTALMCRDFYDAPDNANFSLYLGDRGLVIHDVVFASPAYNHCIVHFENPFNPTVIPYRALTQFMKSGSLRDELLK